MSLHPVTTPLNYPRTLSPSPPLPGFFLSYSYFTHTAFFLPFSIFPFLNEWVAQNTFAALILIGCRHVKQSRSANEIVLFNLSASITSTFGLKPALQIYSFLSFSQPLFVYTEGYFHTIVSCYNLC